MHSINFFTFQNSRQPEYRRVNTLVYRDNHLYGRVNRNLRLPDEEAKAKGRYLSPEDHLRQVIISVRILSIFHGSGFLP